MFVVIDGYRLGSLTGHSVSGSTKASDGLWWDDAARTMHCREAVEECLRNAPRSVRSVQEWYLLIVKEVCKLASQGQRNEPLEAEVSAAYLRHNGTKVFEEAKTND